LIIRRVIDASSAGVDGSIGSEYWAKQVIVLRADFAHR
jgi:hypothetical protein